MVLDIIPQSLYKLKIRTRQRRLKKAELNFRARFVSIDDYLLSGNELALRYFERNKNPFIKLWEYHGLTPKCGSHSLYTYAAFLSLSEGEHELQEKVRWVGGFYLSKQGNGHHAWLEKKVEDQWQAFETIPEMRDMPAQYSPWYTFQLVGERAKVTSERTGGLLAIAVYGFPNS
ncbi:hypothetical protein HY636_00470 [Candidatus Woesearchaeota archaeon]|nr:hypothetical protein [Candidatus Woesearchaeota archaeon]